MASHFLQTYWGKKIFSDLYGSSFWWRISVSDIPDVHPSFSLSDSDELSNSELDDRIPQAKCQINQKTMLCHFFIWKPFNVTISSDKNTQYGAKFFKIVYCFPIYLQTASNSGFLWKPLTFLQCPNLETIDVFAVLQSGNHWRFSGAPIWKLDVFLVLQSGNIDAFLGKHSTRNSASKADLKLKEGSDQILTMFKVIREPKSLIYGFFSQLCRVPLRTLSESTKAWIKVSLYNMC